MEQKCFVCFEDLNDNIALRCNGLAECSIRVHRSCAIANIVATRTTLRCPCGSSFGTRRSSFTPEAVIAAALILLQSLLELRWRFIAGIIFATIAILYYMEYFFLSSLIIVLTFFVRIIGPVIVRHFSGGPLEASHIECLAAGVWVPEGDISPALNFLIPLLDNVNLDTAN